MSIYKKTESLYDKSIIVLIWAFELIETCLITYLRYDNIFMNQ